MPEPLTIGGAIKTTLELIASAWKRGALLLWSCTAAAAVALVVLFVATRLQVGGASELSSVYGIYLLLIISVLGVFSLFKTYSERQARPLILIANDRRSMWGQAKQSTGQTITTLSLHFQATNVSDGTVQISNVRLYWPWVSRRTILDTVVLIEAPHGTIFSSRNPILPHALREVGVVISIDRPIGRAGNRLSATIKVQDHARNWYTVTFRHLKSSPIAPPAGQATP
jgi:hypothetical protein